MNGSAAAITIMVVDASYSTTTTTLPARVSRNDCYTIVITNSESVTGTTANPSGFNQRWSSNVEIDDFRGAHYPRPHKIRYCHTRWFATSSPPIPLSHSPRANVHPIRQEGWRLAARVHQVTTSV